MNILLTINKKYVKLVNILLNSIQLSNKDTKFDVYILHRELDIEDKNIIESGLDLNKFNIKMIKIDEEEVKNFPQYQKRYPKEIYFRLFATKYLPENIDKILYLDSDTLVINKLDELYNMDFEGNFYIATTHVKKILRKINEVRLRIDDDVPYINTGVLLINLKELRKIDVQKEVCEFVENNSKKLMLPDQDIITALYGEKIKIVDALKYNLGDRDLNIYNLNHIKNPIGLKWVKENTVIIHYYGRNKPWNKNYRGKLGVFYYRLERILRGTGKVLILSCGTGGGHNSAAKAILEELLSQGLEADFMEYLEIINTNLKNKVNEIYLKSTNNEGKTFKVAYKLGEIYQKTNIKSPVYGLNQLNKNKLYDYIKRNGYEYIITTHLFAAQALTAIKKEHRINFTAVATDYVCIPFWRETNPDFMITPSDELKSSFINQGVKENKLIPLGIPVKRAYSEDYDINECKKKVGLDINKRYVLLLTGSMGFGNVEEIVDELKNNIKDINLIVACGTNKELYEKLNKKDNVIALEFTENIDLYMKSSDIILSKPGGLTSTEIAVLGKPFIHTMPIPGCENYNANFFESHKMSLKCMNIPEIVESTKLLLENKDLCMELVENQRKYMNRNSCKDLVNLIKKEIKIRNERWKKKMMQE